MKVDEPAPDEEASCKVTENRRQGGKQEGKKDESKTRWNARDKDAEDVKSFG
jgi:hypothetical protein